MGDESGGGGGGAPKGASVRGQVGLTKKEQNQRAVAQEKGGRQSAGVAGPSSRAGAAPARSSSDYGAMSPSDVASESMDKSVDQFTTSTTGAFRDLDDRVNKGQISQRVQDLPSVVGMAATGLNKLGKYTAGKIRSGIDAGGTPVYDSIGRIQGVVETKDTPFGKGDVYTGGSSYDPIGTGKKAQPGIGYVMSATDVQASERLAGGGDDGGATVGTTQTAATATNVTGSTTQLSTAARRQALQGAAGGASRRQFI
jgi:hypothetical protein